MFPNPQDALPLPPRPSIERYKKIAKDLVKACKSGKPDLVRRWAEEWVQTLVNLSGITITPQLPVRIEWWIDKIEEFARRKMPGDKPGETECGLASAQFVIARSHGFESWPKFANHLKAVVRNSPVTRFEAAADAIVGGNIATLERLLRDDPALIRTHSTREHGATLLHYVSANGVEGYRQTTPKNIVEITELLLRAGANVDATADVYGGGCTTLGLTATSLHPERAGVQEALLQKLLDYGAKLDLLSSAGNRQSIVTGCLANGRPKAAEFLAGKGARLDLAAAAGLGRLDSVKPFFAESAPTQAQLNDAFLYACAYGHNNVVEFLIGKGVDLAAQDRNGQTGLHWAVIGGQLETVNLLLRHNPPLKVENIYGGTALGQAQWSAAHGGDADLYSAICEALIAAAAKMRNGGAAELSSPTPA